MIIKKTIKLNIEKEYLFDIAKEDQENGDYHYYIIISPKKYYLKNKYIPDNNNVYEEDFIKLLDHHGFFFDGDSLLTYKDINTNSTILALENNEQTNEVDFKKYNTIKKQQVEEATQKLIDMGLEKTTII